MRITTLRVARSAAIAVTVWAAVNAARASVNRAEADRYALAERALTALDARINEAVLSARAGRSGDYDDLVRNVTDLEHGFRVVAAIPSYVEAADAARLTAAVLRAREGNVAKESAVERFKSDNSVLRNSVRFFPLETARLTALFSGDPSAHELVESLRSVSADVLLYGLFPDHDLATRIEQGVDRVVRDSRALSTHETEILIHHVSIILGRTAAVDALMRDILDAGAAARIRDVDEAYTAAYGHATRRSTLVSTLFFFTVLIAVVLIAVDVIRRQQLASRALAQTTAKLEEAMRTLDSERLRVVRADRMKSAFLATMSHELRTPLNAIIGFTRIVMRKGADALAAKQLENLGRVEQSGLSLLGIINDILDLSKVEAGRMEFHPEPIDVEKFFRELVERLSPLATEKAIDLTLQISRDVPALVADPKRLAQVVTNLTSNAVKFTREGGVSISVTPCERGLRVAVRDTGQGIPGDQLDRIFEPFHQVDGSATREVSGTGLGLAIVKQMVEAMGGEVGVESRVGTGSSFFLELPLFSPGTPPWSADT